MKHFLVILLVIGLIGCEPIPPSSPMPTPVSVFLAYPVYLQPAADRVVDCANENPLLALFLDPIPADQSQLPGVLLQLQLGEYGLNGNNFYQVGEEEIKIIVNTNNPLFQLSTDQLVAIYSGQQTHWEYEDQPEIQVWAYPPEDNLRILLETAIPGTPRLSSRANIAPTPMAVIRAVASDPAALGFVPGTWLDNLTADERSSIKTVELDATVMANLTHPVLISVEEPLTPAIHSLVACMQNFED